MLSNCSYWWNQTTATRRGTRGRRRSARISWPWDKWWFIKGPNDWSLLVSSYSLWQLQWGTVSCFWTVPSEFIQLNWVCHILRVDALVMRQLIIDWFKMITLKLQAVSHNTTPSHNTSLYSIILLSCTLSFKFKFYSYNYYLFFE